MGPVDRRLPSGLPNARLTVANGFFTDDYVALGVYPEVTEAAGRAAKREVSFWPPLETLKRVFTLRWPSRDDLHMLAHFLADPWLPLVHEEIPGRLKKIALRFAK